MNLKKSRRNTSSTIRLRQWNRLGILTWSRLMSYQIRISRRRRSHKRHLYLLARITLKIRTRKGNTRHIMEQMLFLILKSLIMINRSTILFRYSRRLRYGKDWRAKRDTRFWEWLVMERPFLSRSFWILLTRMVSATSAVVNMATKIEKLVNPN